MPGGNRIGKEGRINKLGDRRGAQDINRLRFATVIIIIQEKLRRKVCLIKKRVKKKRKH